MTKAKVDRLDANPVDLEPNSAGKVELAPPEGETKPPPSFKIGCGRQPCVEH